MDEDSMDQRLVRALRARGADVQTALDANMIARPDADHLRHATEQERVLYTFNVADFYELHTQVVRDDRTHAGLLLAPQQQHTIGEQMRRILHLGQQFSAKDMENRVFFLNTIPGFEE
jgi:hypothetical protein